MKASELVVVSKRVPGYKYLKALTNHQVGETKRGLVFAKKFAKKEGLSFTELTDADKKVLKDMEIL